MNNIFSHWKSTVSGLLTATLATSAAFLAPPLNAMIPAKWVLYLGAAQIIGKVWIGLISQDADKTMAILPGNPEPQAVPAHSVPDNPAAIPVIKPENEAPKP